MSAEKTIPEICINCTNPTGKAGEHEDSLYINGVGPFCEECCDLVNRADLVAGLVEAAKACKQSLEYIRGGRKGSIGSVDNVYMPQLNRENLDGVYNNLKQALAAMEEE